MANQNNAHAKNAAMPTVDINAIPLNIGFLANDGFMLTKSRLCCSVNNDGVIVAVGQIETNRCRGWGGTGAVKVPVPSHD